MAKITIEPVGCKEGLLTVGVLSVVHRTHVSYPTATHLLAVDILPVKLLGPNTGLTFVGPTIEIQIDPTISGSVQRWLVPMSSANQPNAVHPEYFDGTDWRSFLDKAAGVPQTASRATSKRRNIDRLARGCACTKRSQLQIRPVNEGSGRSGCANRYGDVPCTGIGQSGTSN